MSIDDLKQHWREYKRQQKLKEEENEERRKEAKRKQREAADWIHSKIKKTKFHSLLEQEASPAREAEELKQQRAHLKEQKDAYSKVVSQIYKPKHSEQLQAEREQRIKETDKEAFKRRKIEIQSSPYRDYFQEGFKAEETERPKEVKSVSPEPSKPAGENRRRGVR